MAALRVSYSSVQDWRQCQQRYWYRHVLGLVPKVRFAAPELGTMIHDYFDRYYTAIQDPANKHRAPQNLHVEALKNMLTQYKPEIASLASLADSLGAEDEAKKLLAIPGTAKHLLVAYHRVHGADDAEQFDILKVETKFELPIGKDIVLPGRIDLVTNDDRQDIFLWEHKTTGSIPSQGHRFRDLQTLIYKVAVEELYNYDVRGVIWNYIHTAPPRPPALLQRGGLSVAKHQTTTLGLFKRELKAHNLDPAPYRPYMRSIERRERTVMFPRQVLPLGQDERVLLRDYVASVHQIAEARENKRFIPVRNIAAHCDWCPYVKLCTGAVTGGDTRILEKKNFTTEERK